ncbi:MAG: hypothetical protein A2Z71_02705 [Chloroflexi bacterium RBG_13_50_21]|nr:MAG: hypothetical protein A2Z71_02705 [Chloroflexi bacterium RBG_13_50_21]
MVAGRLATDLGVTIIAISSASSSEGYNDIVTYIDIVHETQLKKRLEWSINRCDLFRNYIKAQYYIW